MLDVTKCPHICGNKTADGYCAVTACTNPEHNGSGTYVYGKNGLEKYNPNTLNGGFTAPEGTTRSVFAKERDPYRFAQIYSHDTRRRGTSE